MEEYQKKPGDLIDTTDCLEAVGVFRGWKNFLFIITFVCLLQQQLSFWAVNTGHVKPADTPATEPAAVIPQQTQQARQPPQPEGEPAEPVDEIAVVAKELTGEPNQQIEQKQIRTRRLVLKQETFLWTVRFFNFVLVLAAALYCLTMLFILKVSMLGRLGGINHIARAFFLSLLMFVLLLPWQVLFRGVVSGAMYMPKELLSAYQNVRSGEIIDKAFYYLRYTAYWLLVLLLLIFSQVRSCRWAKAILRRLEVI